MGAPNDRLTRGPRRVDLLRGTGLLMGGRGIAAGISAVWLFAAARELGVTSFGDLALLLASYGMFAVLADLGLPVLLAGRVARAGCIDPALLADVLRKRLIGSGVATAAVAVAYLVSATDPEPLIPLLFAGSVVGNAVHSTYSAALRSVGRVLPEGLNEVGSRIIVAGTGVMLLAAGGGVAAAAGAYSAADLLSSVVLRSVVVRHVRDQPDCPAAPPIRLADSLPLCAAAALGGLYYRIDAWIVGLLAGSAATGLYAAAYRFVEVVLLPSTVVGAVALGHVLSTAAERRRRQTLEITAMVVAGTAILAAILALVAQPLMIGAFGDDFTGGDAVLRVLLLSAVPGAAVAALGPLTAVGRSRGYAAALAVALTANVALNLVLVPASGALGAAWANVASQGVLGTVFVVMLVRAEWGAD